MPDGMAHAGPRVAARCGADRLEIVLRWPLVRLPAASKACRTSLSDCFPANACPIDSRSKPHFQPGASQSGVRGISYGRLAADPQRLPGKRRGGVRSMEKSQNGFASTLEAISQGDVVARQELSADIYHQLRVIARHRLGGQQRTNLDTTILVHEAYLKIAGAAGGDQRQ